VGKNFILQKRGRDIFFGKMLVENCEMGENTM
jgi:hypothetical protein